MLKATPSKGAWLWLLLASQTPTIPALSIFRQIAIAVGGVLDALLPELEGASCVAPPMVSAFLLHPSAPIAATAAPATAIFFIVRIGVIPANIQGCRPRTTRFRA